MKQGKSSVGRVFTEFVPKEAGKQALSEKTFFRTKKLLGKRRFEPIF